MGESDVALPEQEWSHNFSVEDVDTKPVKTTISAPEDSFSGLCNRLNLCSIETLSADLVLTRNSVNKVIHIEGRINAEVHQQCVVSAEPVAEQVSDTFEAWFAEPSNAVSFTKVKRERDAVKDKNEQPIIEEADDPEEVVDGKIDLGELVTQHLSLSLNPYPRAEGAEHNMQETALEEDDDIYANPFAALKDWKTSEKKKDK